MKRILVVEDDIMLNSGLCYNLELDEYQAVSALSKDRLDYDEWKRLSRLLPELGWNNSWDKCKRLRKAAKKAGYSFKLTI